jgi:ATPase subunit of ABC transporter with duplicated ATPase domains
MENVVDRMFVLEGDGIVRKFSGQYNDYLEYIAKRAQAREAAQAAALAAARQVRLEPIADNGAGQVRERDQEEVR